jgi:hypothetical protein
MSNVDVHQIGHIARLAVLAMCARGVAAVEFENSPEVSSVVVVVSRSDPTSGEQFPVDLEFVSDKNVSLGGVSL